MDALLSKEQRLMFMSHKKRAIELPSTSSSSSCKDEEDDTDAQGNFGTENEFKGVLSSTLLGF